MKSISRKTIEQTADRSFWALVIVVTILMSWVGVAYAESKSGIYVSPFGYYGAGYTTFSGDNRYAKTYWTNGVSVYNIYVNLRHWHIHNMEEEVFDNKFNTTSTVEVSLGTGTTGNDTAQHYIRGTSVSVATVFYTSTGTGDSTFSCWYSGC